MVRFCQDCNRMHMNILTTRCSMCRRFCNRHNIFHNNNIQCHICLECGKPLGRSKTRRCTLCRKYCRFHKDYHDNNFVCKKCPSCHQLHVCDTLRCNRCRIYCKTHSTYHDDNIECRATHGYTIINTHAAPIINSKDGCYQQNC